MQSDTTSSDVPWSISFMCWAATSLALSMSTSGVNGKPVYRISFRLDRNDEIRKEYLRTGYWKRHYIRLSTG